MSCARIGTFLSYAFQREKFIKNFFEQKSVSFVEIRIRTNSNSLSRSARYNVIFMVLTYILPIGSMTFTYARIGLELWGSQSIGENTAGQLEGIRSKRRVSDRCRTRTDRKISLVMNNRRISILFDMWVESEKSFLRWTFFLFFFSSSRSIDFHAYALDEDEEKSSKRDSIPFFKDTSHYIDRYTSRFLVLLFQRDKKMMEEEEEKETEKNWNHSNPVEVFARPLFSTVWALTRYRATKLAFIYSPTQRLFRY